MLLGSSPKEAGRVASARYVSGYKNASHCHLMQVNLDCLRASLAVYVFSLYRYCEVADMMVGNMTPSRDVMIATRMIDWSLYLVPVLQSLVLVLVTSHEDSDISPHKAEESRCSKSVLTI